MKNSISLVVLFVVLFVITHVSVHSRPWISRLHPPTSPIVLEPSHYKGHIRHYHRQHQGDFHKLRGAMLHQMPKFIKKRRPAIYKHVVGITRLPKPEEYELVDDDLLDAVPVVIQSPVDEAKSSFRSIETLDKTPLQVEMVHLLRRLLKPKKRMKSSRQRLTSGAHHIIISQAPSETTTSVQTANTCPQPTTGTSGSPRSEAPAGPPPSPVLPPPPPSPPSAVTPQSVPPPSSTQPVSPRSELPTGGVPPSLPVTSAGVITTPSQTSLGLQSIISDQTHAALLPLAQLPSFAITPVLAELGAMLLATQPTLAAAFGLTAADYGHSAHAVAPVAIPQTTTLGLPMPAVVPIAKPVASDTRSSLAAELASLVTSLQQQHELQRQHLQQQQQLQQEQQNLLQQQRSQLAQQLQPQFQPAQPSAVQPQVVSPQPATPQLGGEGRFQLPTGSQFPVTDGTTVTGGSAGVLPSGTVDIVPRGSVGQQIQQSLPQTSTIISMLPRTILSLGSTDDDYDGDDHLSYPMHATRTIRKRKKFFTRKLIRKANDALLY